MVTSAAQANCALGALSRLNHSSTRSITSGWRFSCAHRPITNQVIK
jgi:hypothetical protein